MRMQILLMVIDVSVVVAQDARDDAHFNLQRVAIHVLHRLRLVLTPTGADRGQDALAAADNWRHPVRRLPHVAFRVDALCDGSP